MPSYHAIEALCQVIDSVPVRKKDILGVACWGFGVAAKPTGLSPAPHRTLQQLLWDEEVTDLKTQLVNLVETKNLNEAALVLGVVAWITWWMERQSSKSGSDEARDRQIQMLVELRAMIKLPRDERDGKLSDESIARMMKHHEEGIANFETNRQNAREALNYFVGKIHEVLTEEVIQHAMFKKIYDS